MITRRSLQVALVTFVTFAGSIPLASQGLDSIQRHHRSALIGVRDSLLPVAAAVQSIRRDLGTSAAVTLIAKTQRLHRACRAAQGALRALAGVFDGTGHTPRQQGAVRRMETARAALVEGLTTHCLVGLRADRGGAAADSIRAWVPHHTSQLRAVEARYHAAAGGIAQAWEFRIPPVNPAGN